MRNSNELMGELLLGLAGQPAHSVVSRIHKLSKTVLAQSTKTRTFVLCRRLGG